MTNEVLNRDFGSVFSKVIAEMGGEVRTGIKTAREELIKAIESNIESHADDFDHWTDYVNEMRNNPAFAVEVLSDRDVLDKFIDLVREVI